MESTRGGREHLAAASDKFDKERKPFKEHVFEQLLSFSDATLELKSRWQDKGDLSMEDVDEVLASRDFSERQEQSFRDGAQTLIDRREAIKSTREAYEQEHGETATKKLFQDIFGGTDTFGEITLEQDPNNLIFICENGMDVAQALAPEGEDMGAIMQEMQEAGQELPSSAEIGLPQGAYLGDTRKIGSNEVSLRGGIILINKDEIIQRGSVEVEAVIKHEQQHSENSLYLRPDMIRESELSEHIYPLAEEMTKWVSSLEDMCRVVLQDTSDQLKGEYVSTTKFQKEYAGALSDDHKEAMRTFFDSSIEYLADTLESLTQTFTRGSIETVIKEELLAFWVSGTENDEIDEILPHYIFALKKQMADIVYTFEQMLLKYYPDALLEEMNLKDTKKKRVFDMYMGELSEGRDEDDTLFKHLNEKVFQPFDQLSEKASEGVVAGLEQLKALDELDARVDWDAKERLTPILISQPIDRWERIIKQAEKYREE